MCRPIRGQGGHPVFPIGPKNTNLVEDVEILLLVKFHWIQFSGFRGKVKNLLAHQRPGRPSCFSDRPNKNPTNLVEDVEILLPVMFCWFPFSGFRGEVQNVSANQRPRWPSCFSYRPENHKLRRERWDLASCKVLLISFLWFQRRSPKCSANQRQRRPSCFSDRPKKKHKHGRGRWNLASCQVSLNSVSEKKSKMSQPIRGHGDHLVFPIGPKNTNLVEDVEILILVKFRWIPLSGFRGEVENVSANKRPGRPSCFSDRLEKHKIGRGCWVLASCQVSLNSVQWFQRRSRKCEKITTDGRRTDGGRKTDNAWSQ